MVDYDGQDAIITYLDGLAWTALTEPTYAQYQDQKNSEISNVVIVNFNSLIAERLGTSEYALHHHLSVKFIHNTKVGGWANFKYILTKLWQLIDSNSFYTLSKDISIYFTKSRKIFIIPVVFTEILTM